VTKDPFELAAGVIVTIAIIVMAGYVIPKLAQTVPYRTARIVLALVVLVGAIPAVLYALYGG